MNISTLKFNNVNFEKLKQINKPLAFKKEAIIRLNRLIERCDKDPQLSSDVLKELLDYTNYTTDANQAESDQIYWIAKCLMTHSDSQLVTAFQKSIMKKHQNNNYLDVINMFDIA